MKSFLQSLSMLVLLTVLTGVLYPLVVTFIGHTVFNERAEGSPIVCHGKVAGSALIAQKFVKDAFFWPRPSAADFNASASNGSNLGPTSADLVQQVEARRNKMKATNPEVGEIPDDLVLASGSGLDPDISPESAIYQVARISKSRNYTEEQRKDLTELIKKMTEAAPLGFLGPDRVNVLSLNMKLEGCE